ncbi:MAG: DUF362 domain-containing protein [Candidatus Schekmanbacteria bacterium]|nr:MAG: DUF362 domain-containing protein [Candidatus Schekmanbacteria bacterium]
MKRRTFIAAIASTFFAFLNSFEKRKAQASSFFDEIANKLFKRDKKSKSAIPKINIKRNAEVILCRASTPKKGRKKIGVSEFQNIFEKSVKTLFNVKNHSDAINALFSKDDIIGIKVNCLAGRGLSSNPLLVKAIIESLKNSGFDEEQIIIWDRTDKDLIRAGYEINRGSGVRCFGTNMDYESEISFSGSIGSCFSRILTRECTAIINIPVLKDHDLAGVSIGMKNFYGVIHNPNKYHSDACNPFVADLNNHSEIRNKLRLTVCDASIAQYHGGPAYNPNYSWQLNSILVATDIVSLDSIGWKLIEEKRKEKGLKSLKEEKREPIYIQTAQDLGIGICDRARIKLTEIQ